MPRDSSGNYTLPLGNPVVPETVIETEWANSTMSDIAAQLNNVLTRDGSLSATTQTKFIDGTVAAPGAAFQQALGTGIYRNSTQMGFTWNGSSKATVRSDGFYANPIWTGLCGVTNSAKTQGLLFGYDPSTAAGYITAIPRIDFYAGGDLEENKVFSFGLNEILFYPNGNTAGQPTLQLTVNSDNDPSFISSAGFSIYAGGPAGSAAIKVAADKKVYFNGADVYFNSSFVTYYGSYEVGYRKIPVVSGSGTIPETLRGKCYRATIGPVTVPDDVFTIGDVVTILNFDSNAAILVTPAAGVTMILAGTGSTGARTLADNGIATILFLSGSVCFISGPGVT